MPVPLRLLLLLLLAWPGLAGAQAPEPCPDTMEAFDGSTKVVECSCTAMAIAGGSVWGSGPYTSDSRACRAARHAGAVPIGGGVVRFEMGPGRARYPGSTRNGVESIDYGAWGTSFTVSAVGAPPAPVATGPEQCPDNMAIFAGSDEVLRCLCPALMTGQGSVWGTDAYTADSAVCRAALHAGAVTPRGGEVTLRMLEGLPRYVGTTRNRVESQNYGAYGASFRFEGLAASGPGLCPDNMTAYAGSDEVLTCACSGEAVLRGGAIWGSSSYTADSATCMAARHAGVVPVTGGLVTVRMLPGEPRYAGSTRNGVQSQSWASYPAGFRFDGAQNTAAGAPLQAPVAESLRRTGQVSLYVTFRTGSADLDIGAAPVLMQVREAMAADPGLRLRLVGHTDNQGGPAINLPLSQRRAQSVRTWLMQNGVDGARLVAEGSGQTAPIADNGSEAGRSLNRRVEAVRIE